MVKPTVHKINKSVSALKPMIYNKPINHEVLNALYLQPKVLDFSVKDEPAPSKAMSAVKSKEVKFWWFLKTNQEIKNKLT